MPGHDPSSFVSRDRGQPEVIDGRVFAPQSGFRACRPACGRTIRWPCRCRTSHKPRYGRQENNTSAETYGEPQTPAELPKSSIAASVWLQLPFDNQKNACQVRSSAWMGRRRRRLPVAAKMALQIAGAITGTVGSPMPVGFSVLATMWTSTGGASFIRIMA